MYFTIHYTIQVILAIGLVWLICVILTEAGVFPDDVTGGWTGANTHRRLDLLNEAPWFRFPYPGRRFHTNIKLKMYTSNM